MNFNRLRCLTQGVSGIVNANMDSTQNLKSLIEKSDNILITSHISPDPDSLCSMLLLGSTLECNYPEKTIIMVCEEEQDGFNFLAGYENIKFQPMVDITDKVGLIILVDAMNFERCSYKYANTIRQKVKEQNIKIAIIDHHEQVGVEENDAYINHLYPAAVQEVYELCFKNLGYKKPGNFAEITMTGLYSDTAGFTYLGSHYEKTLNLELELLREEINIEEIKNSLNQYNLYDVEVITEVLGNIEVNQDYTYSFISDDFIKNWTSSGKPPASLLVGIKFFTDHFIRNINGNQWGFAVHNDLRLGEGVYSVSLRSLSGVKDVSLIAREFGGGGHKPASGAKVPAQTVDEAIAKVQAAIAKS
jgi:phosphoesterase RecJ-like protein